MTSEKNTSDSSGISRRTFVAGSAAGWASVALAGCSGGGTDTESPTETTETETESPTGTVSETPAPQPENFVVTDEIITGSEYVPPGYDGFASSCAPSRTFVPGMQPVFKIGVFDPATGDQLGNDALDGVGVNIDSGPTVELAWGGDAEENPAEEWSGNWVIPEDTEPGSMSYTVEVSGGDGNYHNVGILENSFEVIEYNDPRNYVVTDDLYAGSAGVPENNPFISSCAPSRQFAPGMMVGFDIGVYEGQTGNPVGPTDFEYEGIVQGIEAATITLEGRGVSQELEWAAGENEDGEMVEDFWWNTTWFIPEDAEPGTVTYTVEVQADVDATPVGALSSEFTIVDA